jgi:hypothetical protein
LLCSHAARGSRGVVGSVGGLHLLRGSVCVHGFKDGRFSNLSMRLASW